MSNETNYKLVLGLEIHIHVKTDTGMFCGCSSDIYDVEPNTRVCPVCLGLPGALPVPNEDAVKKTQLLGLALNCTLNKNSRFDRKHYFYPDLPKGYQISQYKQPFCEGGFVMLDSGKKIELERIHLEEDTAKSFHKDGKTLIDFNVSGTPLIELVTKPVLTSAEDAVEMCKKLRDLVRYLGVSDADMEKGQMRIEPNISVRSVEMEAVGELPNYKVEVKNINSFRFMEKAVNYEFARQSKLLEQGETPLQENRGWNEHKNITVAQRQKEEAHDYRYFPEPDIPPMVFDEAYIADLQATLPELPEEIRLRLQNENGLSEQNSTYFVSGNGFEQLAEFEALVAETKLEPNKIANLLINKPEFRGLNPQEFEAKVTADIATLDNVEELEKIVKQVIANNADAVESYKAGKESALQFLLGQVMRETKGKADPEVTQTVLVRAIN